MTATFRDLVRKVAVSIPSLIVITSAIAVLANFYLLFFNHTAIFDPLFYIPIVLAAYYYPQRGVSIAGAFAVLYLLMVMVAPSSHEAALSSFGHAGIFVIIGFAVSYLRVRYPQQIAQRLSFRPLFGITGIIFRKHDVIPVLITVTSALALVLNLYLLIAKNNLIFDPLFYFPIILIAYFYPRRGVLAATAYSLVFCSMVLLTSIGYPQVVLTGLVHAGIFIIIGFVVSYIILLYSHEQEIHRRLAEIVESSGDAITGETLDGIITDWNRGADRLYGYTATEVTGKSVTVLLPPDRPDEPEFLLAQIRNGEPVERHETERVTKDRRRIWVSLSISPIKDAAGTVIGASVIAYDITDRKLAQDALERANKKLHLFSSITRHDVLNQLTVLNIYHNLAQTMTDDPVALSFLEKAQRAADAISRQIRFTHEYDEIGAQKPRWVNVHHSFVSAAAMFKAKPVTITPCTGGLEIYADPLFEEVFYQLIDNSLTYGAVVTAIRCTWQENESGINLVYEDNGVGVLADEKQKIFDRVAGEDTRPGLFLIREILSITNITIEENGEPGKGARFTIHVPRGAYRFTPQG